MSAATTTNQPDDGARARALIYLRVSTKDQAEAGRDVEGYSIPAQREACRRRAETLDADVADEFVDRGESARSSDRPELQRMLTHVSDHSIDYLIVHKVDRLARNRSDDVTIHMALQAAGVRLVSCSENIDETPSGMLLHGIMSSIAEFYSRNLASEVIKGSVQKAKAGGTISKAPCGYVNVRKVVNGREVRAVDIDPQRGPLMRFAFEAYSGGDWTIRDLLEELTQRGLTPTPGPNKPSKRLAVSHVRRRLRRPDYTGWRRYKGVEYPNGQHEALVDDATWQKVQDQLDAKGRSGEKRRKHHHYLKGTVFCGDCGSRLIVSRATNRHGTTYPYFICVGRQQKRTACAQAAILISEVEDLVAQHYRTIQPSQKTLSELRDLIVEELAVQRDESETERSAGQRRIRKLQDERKKLLEAHYADAIGLDLLKSEQTRITRELEQTETRLDAVDVAYDTVKTNLDHALTFVGDWTRAYRTAEGDIRRQLNQSIFEKIWIDDTGMITSRFTEPFRTLLGDDVRVPARIRAEEKTGAEPDEIDRQWEAFSARWEAERLQGQAHGLTGLRHRDVPPQQVLAAVGASIKNEADNGTGDGNWGGNNKPRHGEPRRGLKYETLVGAEGLEPPTPSL